MSSGRKWYLDWLRCISMLAVISIHVCAQNIENISVYSDNWLALNFYECISRFCVPVFCMISGSLMLSDDHDIEKVWKHNITKTVITYIVWSTGYAILYRDFSFKQILFGPNHLWYIHLIIGFYMIVPILTKVIKDRKIEEYFIVISICYTCMYHILKIIPYTKEYVQILHGKNNLYFLFGYTMYFLLGHYLDNYNLSKKKEKAIIILAISSVIITFYLTQFISVNTGRTYVGLYEYLLPTTLLESVALFIIFKKYFYNKKSKAIQQLSKDSFGIYLVHMMVLFVFNYAGIDSDIFNSWGAVPIIIVVTTMASFISVEIIRKIPVLNRILL